MGKRNVTKSGKTCQRWDKQRPHTHAITDVRYLPDATLSLAENFCRNPWDDTAPWCYTMNPSLRWEFCDIPMCTAKGKRSTNHLADGLCY